MFNFTIIIILFFFSKLESKEFCEINEFDNLTHKIIECRRRNCIWNIQFFFQKSLTMIKYLEVYEIKIIKKLKKNCKFCYFIL